MSRTLSEVTRDAAGLPLPDRYKLARILLDDLPGMIAEPPDEVQAAWDNEIERRLQELRSGTAKAVPLEEAKRRIEARFRS